MQYLISPSSTHRVPFVWWENVFNQEQLDWLQNKARNSENTPLIGGGDGGNYVPQYRDGLISWLNYSECKWAFEILSIIISKANVFYYNFDIVGFGEPLQLTNYTADKESKYNWHVDYGEGLSRKLSLVVQLSNSDEYSGGILQLLDHSNNIINIDNKRGYVVMFPSFSLHRVTPVTSGSRQSLVSWITGPPFK